MVRAEHEAEPVGEIEDERVEDGSFYDLRQANWARGKAGGASGAREHRRRTQGRLIRAVSGGRALRTAEVDLQGTDSEERKNIKFLR